MKKFEELTDAEVLALTDEDLERYVKLRMAEDGIKILPEPVEPTYVTIPEKDDMAYALQGFNYYFKDKAAADRVSAAIIKEKVYDEHYKSDYSLRWLKPRVIDEYNTIGAVSPKPYYKESTVEAIQDTKKANDKLKKEYDEQYIEYTNAQNEAEYIRDEIYDRYAAVHKDQREKELMLYRFNEYLELANNNEEIAMNFLKKAYTVTPEIENYITEKRENI